MAITLSSEQFNRQLPEAAQAARTEIVIFEADGAATHVLMSFEEYRRLVDEGPTLAEAFSMPIEAGDAIDFEIPHGDFGFEAADLS
jgi:hypothetical protein